MSCLTKFRARTMAPVLATSLMTPAAVDWSQTASQLGVSGAEGTDTFEIDLAQKIS
jgi:hypothetical protein